MLLIDRTKDFNYITVNATDTFGAGEFIMNLYSHYTKRSFMFNLYDDKSENPTRCNVFKINTLQFFDMTDGDYIYKITQQDVIKDSGLLRIFSPDDFNIYTERADSDDDDYFIYEG